MKTGMVRTCAAAVVTMGLVMGSLAPAALGDEPLHFESGDVRMFAFLRVPGNLAACDGAKLPIAGNEKTYARIAPDIDGQEINVPKLDPVLAAKTKGSEDVPAWAVNARQSAESLLKAIESVKAEAEKFQAACDGVPETKPSIDQYRGWNEPKRSQFEDIAHQVGDYAKAVSMTIAEFDILSADPDPTKPDARKASLTKMTAQLSQLRVAADSMPAYTRWLRSDAAKIQALGETKLDTAASAVATSSTDADAVFASTSAALSAERPAYTVAIPQYLALDGILDQPYMGEIRLFATGFVPRDWVACNGATLRIRVHEAIYSLLGDRFGSDDGRTWFAVPTIAAPKAIGKNGRAIETPNPLVYCLALHGTYPTPDARGGKAGWQHCYTGEIRLMATLAAPAGWLECDGRELPVDHPGALYYLLGTSFGGTPYRTFNLPRFAPVKSADGKELRYFICTNGIYPSRE